MCKVCVSLHPLCWQESFSRIIAGFCWIRMSLGGSFVGISDKVGGGFTAISAFSLLFLLVGFNVSILVLQLSKKWGYRGV